MESVRSQLIRIREGLAPEEWRDSRIYVHNDVEFEHFTLISTKVSTGEIYIYNLESGKFAPLNPARVKTPT